jgi:hypothetical protein
MYRMSECLFLPAKRQGGKPDGWERDHFTPKISLVSICIIFVFIIFVGNCPLVYCLQLITILSPWSDAANKFNRAQVWKKRLAR